MKPILLSLSALSLFVIAVAQGTFRFADPKKGVILTARDGRGARLGTNGWRVTLTGDVVAQDTKENVEIRAQRITADVADGKSGASSDMSNAIAEGKVRITKIVRASGAVQTTQIEGSRADYKASATQGVVEMAGPVTIRNTNPSKRETLVATGSRGKAFLVKGKSTNNTNALTRAELRGNVRTVVTQQGAQGGKLIATGGNMVLEQGANSRTITLTDNVNVNGSGTAQEFSASSMKRVVMVLNQAGEVVEWNAVRQ